MEKLFDINESGYSVRCKLYCSNVNAVKRVVIFGHGFGGRILALLLLIGPVMATTRAKIFCSASVIFT